MILANTAALYSVTALGPLQETIRVALALSDNHMALLQGPALALSNVLLAIPFGIAVDRYTRVQVLRTFFVLGIAGGLLTAAGLELPNALCGALSRWPWDDRHRYRCIFAAGRHLSASAAGTCEGGHGGGPIRRKIGSVRAGRLVARPICDAR